MKLVRLTNERYDEIKIIIVEMYQEYSIYSFPFDVFELAKRIGIKIIPYSKCKEKNQGIYLSLNHDGFSVLLNYKWRIYYNDLEYHARIRNTIMHEIGHILLDHEEINEITEAEAKFFAKYSLAPPPIINQNYLNSAESIKEYFDISEEAACYAYEYYKKWLGCSDYYKDYEFEMLKQFEKWRYKNAM